jgi:pyruvate/2-oxoglutarate dehydrogenase complex dihydrolipoamide dehydrogenase (E3) component
MAAMIKKVGVIGSGQMGNGIAHVAALAGFDVVLNDVSADRLKSAMATINGNLSRQVSKKIITEDARKQGVGADRLGFPPTMASIKSLTRWTRRLYQESGPCRPDADPVPL